MASAAADAKSTSNFTSACRCSFEFRRACRCHVAPVGQGNKLPGGSCKLVRLDRLLLKIFWISRCRIGMLCFLTFDWKKAAWVFLMPDRSLLLPPLAVENVGVTQGLVQGSLTLHSTSNGATVMDSNGAGPIVPLRTLSADALRVS